MATIETIRRIRVQTLSEGGDAARRDLSATADAHAKLASATGASGVVIDLAARKQLSANAAFEKARIQVDALYAAQVRYERQVQNLNRGYEQGEKSLEDYNSALELAKLKYDAAVASATKFQATQRALAQESIAAAKAQEQQAEAYQKTINARFGVGPSAGAARGDDIEAAFASADKLRAKYDELFAASQRYESARNEITGANKAGILTDEVAAASIQKVTQAYRDQVSVLNNVARMSKESAQRTVNQQTIPARDRGADIDAYGAEMDRRRAQYDQVFAAGQTYRAGLAQLRQDLSVGAITESLYTAELDRRKAAFAEQINGLGNYSRAQREAAQAVQDAAAVQQAAADKLRAVQMVSRQTVPARDRQSDVEAAFAQADRIREALVPAAKVQREYTDAVKLADDAVKLGMISQDEYVQAIDRAKARQLDQNNEIDKAVGAHKRLAGGAGLSAYAYQNLGYQVNDVVTSLASGISPMQTFTQQGGQILQVLQSGDGGVKGALKGIASTSVGFVAGLGAMTLATGAFITGAAAGAIAAYDFSSQTQDLSRQLQGLGRASMTSVGQIDALAQASAGAAGVSVREFRSMAGTFAATGEIGGAMFVGLIKAAKDYSRSSGQDLKAVTAELAVAFADPGKGAEDLSKKLGILSYTQLESIKRMEAQGNTLGAQKALLDAYTASIDRTKETTAGWGRIMADAGNMISDAWTAAGRAIDKVVNGGSLDEQLEEARKRLSNAQVAAEGGFGLFSSKDVEESEKVLKRLEDLVAKRDEVNRKAAQYKESKKAGEFLSSLSPSEQSIKRLEDGATMLKARMDSIGLDKQGEAKRAIDHMREQARQMREDMEKGGANFADSLRNSQFQNRMVGAQGFGLDAATINKNADDRRIEAFRNASTDVSLDAFNKQVSTIEQDRITQLDTLTKTTVEVANKVGGAFAQMSKEVQAQILAGAQRFPRVPPALIAALAKGESGGNLDVGYTKILDENGKVGSAYGLGQVTRTTGNEIQQKYGIDRMNRDTMGEAIAAVVQTKLDAVGGDLDKAIMAYRGSKDPAVNRSYLAEVKKRMGEAGDISVGAQANVQDANTRAARDANDELKRQNDLYGINTEKLNTQAKAQSEYNRLIDAGMPPNEEFRKSLMGIAAAAEAASRDVKLVQFQRDQGFAREQLGRTDGEQQAYSTARSMYGDTNDPRARTVIDEVTQTQNLTETKSLIRDGATSFVSELRRTGDAAGALANVFGNIADKMISKVLDSLVSSAFSSGGGGLGGIGKLFGFANGGIMTSGGAMPLHAYASGGIANSPQMALFGEGRMPEAYVPLPDGKRIPVSMSGAGNSNVTGPTTVGYSPTFNFPQQIDGLTPQQASALIDRKQQDFANKLPELVRNAQKRRA